MKKYILILTAIFLASFAYTQSNKEEVDLFQAAFGMEKKQLSLILSSHQTHKKMHFGNFMMDMRHSAKGLGKRGSNY